MSGDEFIGNSRRNLVLKTAGSIRVLVGDRYYDLDFRNEGSNNKSSEAPNSVADEASTYAIGRSFHNDDIAAYNGTNEGSLSRQSEEVYNIELPYSITTDGTVIANSTRMVSNLNAQFLNGNSDTDFIKKDRIQKFNKVIFDSISSSDGNFYYKNGKFSLRAKNEFEYMSLSSDTTLDLSYSNYSILSNGYKILLPAAENGFRINVFAIDDITIDTSLNSIILLKDSYNSFIYIPISENEYKWVAITDDNFYNL